MNICPQSKSWQGGAFRFALPNEEERIFIMKRSLPKTLITIAAALVMAAVPTAAAMTAFAATTTLPSGSNLRLVTETGSLDVTLPTNISDSFEVKAYEMLQLVIPKNTTWTHGTAMTNNDNSQNLYVVTDVWSDFFSTAKAAYTDATNPLTGQDTLYLTYDAGNARLNITSTAPAASAVVNEDYIMIDNAAYSFNTATNKVDRIGRLDTTYFEADLVSRIVDSPDDATETTASAARLLSDWASRYVKANAIVADAADNTPEGSTAKKFELADLNYGYYVIIANDKNSANGDQAVVNQSILNVPMALSVSLKATPITVDKSVDSLIDANKLNNSANPATDPNLKNTDSTRYNSQDAGTANADKITANIGDILQYKVESHIPSLTSYDFVSNSAKLLGIADEDVLTDDNFLTRVGDGTTEVEKFVYVLKDKMINQDFIAADTAKNGVSIAGLKMEVYNADGSAVDKTYVVKELDFSGTKKYYIVLAANADSVTNANFDTYAIGRLWETEYGAVSGTYSNFFAVNFKMTKLKSEGIDGRKVVFTYNAELMGEAGSANANDAKITYSNDPFDVKSKDTITPDNTTNVYTYDLKISKKFSDGSTTDYFNNVKFKLYSDSAKQHSIKFTLKGAENSGSYVRSDSSDSTTTDTLAVNTTDGTLFLHGLGEGTYYLEEQPDAALSAAGYNIANIITVVISAKDGTTIYDADNFDLFNASTQTKSSAERDLVALTITPITTGSGASAVTNEYGIAFEVLNQKGFRLPLTGEYGNRMLAIGGIVLVAIGGTVIVLVNRKKKDGQTA